MIAVKRSASSSDKRNPQLDGQWIDPLAICKCRECEEGDQRLFTVSIPYPTYTLLIHFVTEASVLLRSRHSIVTANSTRFWQRPVIE
jgi:hypothetical protein